MNTFRSALLGGTAFLIAGATAACAGPHHRAHHNRPVAGYGYAYGYGYDSPGAIVARATARAQTEPGVTSELAPDAVQTATGGPSGGVPGFSGP